MVAAIYWGCATIVVWMASAIFFKIHENFRKRCGELPPDIVYGKDYLGNTDYQNIIWKTPDLKDWGKDDIGAAKVVLFLLKWITLAAGLFFAATTFVFANGLMK